jgi:hypothetical protein
MTEGLLKKDEHPPAMHSALGWCKHGYIFQMFKLDSHRFQGIAGRSNIERPTSNVEWEKMKKQTYDLAESLLEYSVRIIKTKELIKIFVASIKAAEKKQK